MSNNTQADRLIWIDLEMTGLNPEVDKIIEIATVVTDKSLKVVAEGPVIAIHQPDEVLAAMDEWNTQHHGASGLIDRVKRSRYSAQVAESETLSFLQRHVSAKASPMCGNSICQDRRFLYREMPLLVHFFHYRNLDVSTLKLLAQRWAPHIVGFNKESQHLALADIYDSIEELKYYRERIMSI